MKTTTICQRGSGLPALFLFWPKPNAAGFARLSVLALALLATAPSQAAKPGGGGTPQGTIYYIGPWPNATGGGTSVMTTMNPNGSNKTVLGLGLFGVPSHATPGGHRWFVYTSVIPGEYCPDGVTKRIEIFALRDDFDVNTNNSPVTKVQLTDDITLQPRVSTAEWVPGNGQVSFMARRWTSAEPGATVVEAGIYTGTLVFGADGGIAGLAAQPAAPAIPLPLVELTPGDPWPDMETYSWGPAGDMVAYSIRAGTELWVADLSGARLRIYSGGVHMPQWSPDGSKIAFSGGGIYTVKPNGTGLKRLVANTATWGYSHAKWSPDGQHVIFGGDSQGGNADLFRAAASGAGLVQLTFTPAPFRESVYEAQGGWR